MKISYGTTWASPRIPDVSSMLPDVSGMSVAIKPSVPLWPSSKAQSFCSSLCLAALPLSPHLPSPLVVPPCPRSSLPPRREPSILRLSLIHYHSNGVLALCWTHCRPIIIFVRAKQGEEEKEEGEKEEGLEYSYNKDQGSSPRIRNRFHVLLSRYFKSQNPSDLLFSASIINSFGQDAALDVQKAWLKFGLN